MCSHELLSLDGFSSAVPSFQMHQVFRGILKRVPPNDATVHGRPLYDDQRRHIPLAGLASPIVRGVPRRAAGSSRRRLRWPRGRLQPNLRHGGLPCCPHGERRQRGAGLASGPGACGGLAKGHKRQKVRSAFNRLSVTQHFTLLTNPHSTARTRLDARLAAHHLPISRKAPTHPLARTGPSASAIS